MAYTGLTVQQRALVEDACWLLVNSLTDQLHEDDDTVTDVHLRAVEIRTALLAMFDEDRTELVVALAWPDRDGGPVPWPRLQTPTGLGRGGPASRWAKVIERRAAAGERSCYSPAASAAVGA